MENFARYSVEDVQDTAAAGKEEEDKEGCRCRRGGGDKEKWYEKIHYCGGGSSRPATQWNIAEGTRSSGSTKPTAAGDVTRLLGEVAKKS